MPFDVPAGVTQLHVRYGYSDRIDSDPLLTGGNTLDIGVFDEHGIAAGGEGFRGWSGSHKDEFTIGAEWATPPYRAGAIGSGIWHVLLGPYKVGPRGCEYTVQIWFDPGLPEPVWSDEVTTRPVSPLPPVREGWRRGDLHCHTVYSDGDSRPAAMLRAARAAGLDFLGVTDHNNVAHHAEYARAEEELGGVTIIPGVEVTTYGGHWNAWGTDRWWDFRDPTAAAVQDTIRAAAAAGALVSVNHPKPFGPAWEYPEVTGYAAVEVWNGPWLRLNAIALAFWESRLLASDRLVAVGGSDTHLLKGPDADQRHSPAPGSPTTWARTGERRDAEAIIAALRAGQSFVSATPGGPQLYLDPEGGHARMEVVGASGAALLVLTDAGCIAAAPVASDRWERRVAIPAAARYVRAQVVDAAGQLLALTNPVWADAL
ncbi:MAG: CehA/McbA family metallohydrolase [Candidatus Limnocylindria bacterium]